MDTLNPDAQATLLLTAHLGKANGEARPLTPTEWGRFAAWLKDSGLRPGSLLTDDARDLLGAWRDDKLPRSRLEVLLGRGAALALAVEKWQRAGLWVMTRADPDYPRRLKERLGPQAPAVFFGCGNRALPSAPAVAVIGSRKAVPEDLAYASALGGYVARAGYAVVSGGARGVDETGMLGALAADGTAVGLLADSLLKAAVAQSWRASLRRGDLALLSPFHPEAGFSPGNAMARNKYVYCLVLAAVVVHSGSSGGTWSGALENLKRGWVPLWVKRAEDPEAGNAGLVAQGGRWLPDLLSEGVVQGLVPVGACPAVLPPESPDATARSSADEAESLRRDVPPSTSVTELATHVAESAVAVPPVAELSPYELFRLKLRQLLGEGERKPREIGTLLGLTGPQLKPWLQQAVDDGLVEKKTKPERYELADSKASAQLGMFDRD